MHDECKCALMPPTRPPSRACPPVPLTYMHDERERLLDANRLHKLPDGLQVRALAAVKPRLRHGAVTVTDPVRSNGVVALPTQETQRVPETERG